MTDQTEMLFRLLRMSLNIEQDSKYSDLSVFANIEAENWEQLFDLSVKQGVLLLSYGGLQYLPSELQPPRKLKLRWCVNVVKGSERYDHYKNAIAKLSNLFLANKTSFLLIKGVTISELYPVPYFRESGDIDIYLLGKAEQTEEMLYSLGIKAERKISKHSTFIWEGVPVENHYTFFDTALRFGRERQLYQKMEVILKNMFSEDMFLPVNTGNVCQLPPQAAALFFIGHTFRHFCCLDVNIRQMCDWTVFFSKHRKNIDNELLSSQIAELGLSEFVCHVNSFCSTYLGFNPYFIVPSAADIKAQSFVLKTIMRYRLKPKIHIPVFDVLRYLFRRNYIYRKYLGKVTASEFLLPEVRNYFVYLLRHRWRTDSKKLSV